MSLRVRALLAALVLAALVLALVGVCIDVARRLRGRPALA
jgi:hypothetical protein